MIKGGRCTLKIHKILKILASVERCAHVSDGPMSDVLVSDVLRAMCS